MPWVSLQSTIVALPGNSHLLVSFFFFFLFLFFFEGGGGCSFISCGCISLTRAFFLTLANLACSNVTDHNTYDLSPALIKIT